MASPRTASRSARTSTGFELGARLGFAVNGLLHVLIGGIAIAVAVGAGGAEADQSGALQQLAATPGGVFVLWVVAFGLAALALWEIVNGVLFPTGEGRKATKRVSSVGKAVAYAAVAISAFTFAFGGSKSSASSSTSLSATVLAAPGGVVLLVIVGLVVLGIGGYFVVSAVRRKFLEELRVPRGTLGSVTRVLGTVGYAAKGVALAVVGILFVVGAVTFDPAKASGLDGALKSLVALPFGQVVLIVVAIGLIAYGLFLALKARYAKL